METKVFEYLLAVEEEKNITKAAERCFISQPALSKHIRQIEQRMGFPLFEKNAEGLIPTRKGQIYLDTCRKLLMIEQDTMKKIRNYKTDHPDTRSVFIDNTLYNFFLTWVYPGLREKFPDIHFSILATDASTALGFLSTGRYDIGIFPFYNTDLSFLNKVPLNDDEYVLAFPDALRGKIVIQNEGICIDSPEEPVMFLSPPLTFYRSLQEELLEQLHYVPENTKTIGSIRETAVQIKSGNGIGFLPYSHVERYHCSYLLLDPSVIFRFNYLYARGRNLNDIDLSIISVFQERARL